MTAKIKSISPSLLRWSCPESFFKFKSTANIKPLNKIVGQERAIEAIRMGAEIKGRGYNIFVTGLSGTGRTTAIKQILEKISNDYCPVTYDFCYVNNFNDHQKPLLVKLLQGQGKRFERAMDEAMNFIQVRLPRLFEEDSYQESRQKIVEHYQAREKESLSKFDAKIKQKGFVRGTLENENGMSSPEVFPVINGKPVQIDVVDEMVEQKKIDIKTAQMIKQTHRQYRTELITIVKSGMKNMKIFLKELAENDKEAAKVVVVPLFNEIAEKFNNPQVSDYIDSVIKAILNNILRFVQVQSAVPEITDVPSEESLRDFLNFFKVNVLTDNKMTECAPIVIEEYPTYLNLFGSFDKVYDSRGFWRTDFTKIKAGSILQADQGYLILNAQDFFSEPGVWGALKRVLLYGTLEIQPIESFYQMSTSYLKPEHIEVNVKVIIIGGQTLYRMLYEYEKGFKKIFKVNAQFDYETKRTSQMLTDFARFISKIAGEENLPHCSPSGVAAIAEWGVERAGSQKKITLRFSDVADVIREAAYYGHRKYHNLIDRDDVEAALKQRRHRHDMIDDKLREMIIEGDMLIDTKGKRVGQINGLTVMHTGQIAFGKPARITATVGAGSSGIINIERESEMSGNIHNKAIFIITGFFNERFAQKKALSFSASIAFEQSYGGIEGDSATAAEIYVILSALSGVPIKQGFAITGSVNQKGDIQPIGGVNDKITGFFEICKQRGFAQEQGVIIPKQNVKDLMLSTEIVQAVKQGKFGIYSIESIQDGTELLMDTEFGTKDRKGNYSAGSIMHKATVRLEELRKAKHEDIKVILTGHKDEKLA